MITIGIDPGKQGVLSVLENGRDILLSTKLPFTKPATAKLAAIVPAALHRLLSGFSVSTHGDEREIIRLVDELDGMADDPSTYDEDVYCDRVDRLLDHIDAALPSKQPGWDRRADCAAIETLGVRPGEKPNNALVMGVNYGLVLGACQQAGIRTYEVNSRVWAEAVGCPHIGSPRKRPKETDKEHRRRKAAARRDRKATRLERVHTLFPGQAVQMVGTDDNKADSVLLAYYAWLVETGAA